MHWRHSVGRQRNGWGNGPYLPANRRHSRNSPNRDQRCSTSLIVVFLPHPSLQSNPETQRKNRVHVNNDATKRLSPSPCDRDPLVHHHPLAHHRSLDQADDGNGRHKTTRAGTGRGRGHDKGGGTTRAGAQQGQGHDEGRGTTTTTEGTTTTGDTTTTKGDTTTMGDTTTTKGDTTTTAMAMRERQRRWRRGHPSPPPLPLVHPLSSASPCLALSPTSSASHPFALTHSRPLARLSLSPSRPRPLALTLLPPPSCLRPLAHLSLLPASPLLSHDDDDDGRRTITAGKGRRRWAEDDEGGQRTTKAGRGRRRRAEGDNGRHDDDDGGGHPLCVALSPSSIARSPSASPSSTPRSPSASPSPSRPLALSPSLLSPSLLSPLSSCLLPLALLPLALSFAFALSPLVHPRPPLSPPRPFAHLALSPTHPLTLSPIRPPRPPLACSPSRPFALSPIRPRPFAHSTASPSHLSPSRHLVRLALPPFRPLAACTSARRREHEENGFRTAPIERSVQDDFDLWAVAKSWAPIDDPNYTLDSTDNLYNKVLECEMCREGHMLCGEISITRSISTNYYSRQEEGIFVALPAALIALRAMRMFQKWEGSIFVKTSLKDLGLKIQLNHSGSFCSNPILCHWRHLHLLKRGSHGHDPCGTEQTEPGALALQCPSCPHPGINLPPGFESVAADEKYLYMKFICMDANFWLKNQLVSNYSQDPGLGVGWAYMLPCLPYEQYVLSCMKDEDISTCVRLQVLAQAHTKNTKGLQYTRVGGAFCGRSEMILPQGVGNLQKGEHYANMDFIFGSVLATVFLPLVLISYDITCQWFVNLKKRVDEHWPESLRVPEGTKLIPAIPKLHEPMHEATNHQVFLLNFIPGVGKSDLETPECVWSAHNALGNSTKTQAPGSRQDTLDDNFQFWNWRKYTEAHHGLMETLEAVVVNKWEKTCLQWEKDPFLKTKPNPYHMASTTLTEAQVQKELNEEEQQHLAAGATPLHATTASLFITLGLELEETQAWEKLVPIYLPGILQYQADLQAMNPSLCAAPGYPEDSKLWLPSAVDTQARPRVCLDGLPEIEEKLRTAQCHNALEGIRTILTIKSRMVAFKNKNVRGQREGTRSCVVIDRVHERARAATEKYRAARAVKLVLSGPGDWVQELQELADGDIRGYQDPNCLGPCPGRRGTLEDNLIADGAGDSRAPTEEPPELTLFNEERTRQDGTGETRRTLCWIWLTKSRSPKPNDANNNILSSEWAKSQAQATHSKEEVLLLCEEMRRTLEYLTWKAKQWRSQAKACTLSADLSEGLNAYALGQALIQDRLASAFRALWKCPLEDSLDDIHNATLLHPDDDEADGNEDVNEDADGNVSDGDERE
ncbi:unnamed protein product [Cyclocybe aegerita]|uniref:CxC2-like cysteine cluster KDZ transposase-associated domain-containing protein n=1 Tax=Cyclocybe aegerita TaxID=1973307 RepID=A0A8S0W305_CYCAE|nr:unnamed protein product [Cyclocybe aegerita]